VPASPAGNAGPWVVSDHGRGQRRRLTLRERATLQSLPYVEGMTMRQVGNAVPPPLAEAIGRAILLSESKR
jgi:site-specific DNA-cytosine methylase